MNNTINISTQNITLAAAQQSAIGNTNGYFQIISFYVARQSGNRPNSTGFVVKLDPRLKLTGKNINRCFYREVYSSDGRLLEDLGGENKTVKEKILDNNLIFVATADDEVYQSDGYLGYMCVQFPANVAVGDQFRVEIALKDSNDNDYPFLFVDSTASNQDRETMNTWTKEHGIINGGFTVV